MLWLIGGVQKVELIGGENWLEHNTIALAAISAASLAALVAILNRRAELRHDREMRNRDHIREMVDLTYVEAGHAMTKISRLMGMVQGTEDWRNEVDVEVDDAVIKAIEKQLEQRDAKVVAALMDLTTASGRLEMRLGAEHPIPTAHRELCDELKVMYDRVPSSVEMNRPEGAREEDDQTSTTIGSAHAHFRDVCFQWINE